MKTETNERNGSDSEHSLPLLVGRYRVEWTQTLDVWAYVDATSEAEAIEKTKAGAIIGETDCEEKGVINWKRAKAQLQSPNDKIL